MCAHIAALCAPAPTNHAKIFKGKNIPLNIDPEGPIDMPLGSWYLPKHFGRKYFVQNISA